MSSPIPLDAPVTIATLVSMCLLPSGASIAPRRDRSAARYSLRRFERIAQRAGGDRRHLVERAGANVGAGAVEEHAQVAGRDAEDLAHVLAWPVIERAQQD